MAVSMMVVSLSHTMASLVSVLWMLVILAFHSNASRPDVVVVTPNVLQSDTVQSVLVSVSGADQVSITITLEDDKNYVYRNVGTKDVHEGAPQLFQFRVFCKDIPVHTQHRTRFVYVRAVASGVLRIDKKVRVAVSCKSSSVFIQTDKPVYSTDDIVNIRIVSVNTVLKPQFNDKVTVDIKNPDDIIIDRLFITSASSSVIRKYQLHLGPSPVEGKYTIIAKYGFQQDSVSKFHFEVKDYVLPRFDVQIVPPKFVTKNQTNIEIKFLAKYTYGKGVVGSLDVRLGICQMNSTKMKQFFRKSVQLSAKDKGEKDILAPNGGYNVFPLGERLCVVAEVTEGASGIKQSSSDSSVWFTDVPVRLDCDLSPPFYRPRLLLFLTVRATYPDGRVAKGISVNATVKGVDTHKKFTSGDGLARFELNVGNPRGDLEVLVKSEGNRIGERCIFQQFQSECGNNGGQLTIQPVQRGKLEVGRDADFRLATTYRGGHDRSTSFVVVLVSRGAIQGFKSIERTAGTISLQIPITAKLANMFCLLAYFTDSCGALVADKTCAETSNSFQNNVSITVKSKRKGHVQPGDEITLSVKAANHSDIALLAVDKGLYILNNENKLTQDQVFNELSNFDKSCGYSGINTQAVFDAAGLAAINTHWHLYSSQRSTLDCPTNNRKRRSSGDKESSCFCTFGKSIVSSVVKQGKKLNRKAKVALQKKCNQLYKNEARLEAECGSVETSEELKTFLKCCLSPLVRPKARTGAIGTSSNSPLYLQTDSTNGEINSQSEYSDIIEFEYDPLLERRTYFPHSWLWNKQINTSQDGIWTVTTRVPDSITNWIFHGIALSKVEGFGVAEPQELEVFKNIFVECHLPYSLRRQEQISVACTVYNYNDNRQRVCLSLLDIPEDLCTTAGIGKQTDYLCQIVEPLDTLTVLLPILPLKVGLTQVTVQLRTQFGGDEVVQEIKVEPEGVLREYDYSNELDPQGSNIDSKCSSALKREKRYAMENRGICYTDVTRGKCGQSLSRNYTKEECCDNQIVQYAVAWGEGCELCSRTEESRDSQISGIPGGKLQKNRYYIRVPDNHIEGSVSAWLGVTGRYLEANIKPISGIEDLLKLPGGCGEQSLIRFGPNVAIVKYLKATGNLLHESAGNLLDLLKRGYIYQQQYRHASGGFTVFQNEEPATWLSAFALRTFCAARNLIFVDDNVIFGILDFLVNNRQRDGGEFFEGTRVIHKEMVGGVQEEDVSLTAYVVVSMLECCNSSNNQLLSRVVQHNMCKAIAYLKQRIKAGAVIRPYSKALAYYALSKSCTCCQVCQTECQSVVSNARLKLDLSATEDQCSKHWQEGNNYDIEYWYHKRSAISVEISAYALCGYVCEGDIEGARSIARWLNGQRNSKGAFVSTQDTVVALTCLGEFAKDIDIKHSLTVNVTALHNKTFHKLFDITDDNYEMTQRTEVPINDVLTAVSTGDGLGIVQVHVEYNTPVTSHENCAFDLNITAHLVKRNKTYGDEKEAVISVCVRYLGVNCTGMAIVDVGHLAGFQPCEKRPNNDSDNSCLKDILDSKVISGLRRYDITNRSVVFYFNKICSTDAICFKYNLIQKFEVKHQVPVSAEAYDYYRQETHCTKFFTVGTGTPKINVLCLDSGNKNDPLCVCEPGRCPKLEAISNRLCNACSPHRYVYKIRVINQVNENSWIKVRVKVVQILKSSDKTIETNSTKMFWLPSICERLVTLENGKEYHLQGVEGRRSILDHTNHIEPWPSDFDDCTETETTKCLEETCSYIRNAKLREKCFGNRNNKNRCKKSGKGTCVDSKEFEKYVNKLEEINHCKNNACQG